MKTTIEIADPLLQQAKAVAAKEGITLRLLLEEGLRSAIDARSRIASEPFRLRDGSFHGGDGLQDGMEWKDLSSLAYENERGGFRP